MVFFRTRFFVSLVAVGLLFFAAFFLQSLMVYAKIGLLIISLLTLIEFVLLFSKRQQVEVEREVPERMSNNEENWIDLKLENLGRLKLRLNIREELPAQLNLRDFVIQQNLKPKAKVIHSYSVEPKIRGNYHFGNLNVFIRTFIGLIERRQIFKNAQELKVYPSFKDLKKYDLYTLKTTSQYGIRKTRRIGHSLEFEQIKNYNRGDDMRHINWKSTAKREQLMVNQYTDEKSKEVYCLIDSGRNMRSPFHGLSLLDYAINSSLIILNNALQNHDKAGMLSFNKKVDQFLKAEQRPRHLHLVMEKLYAIQPEFKESNFFNLYGYVKRMISHRSLLFLFTNFKNWDAFERQLPYLQALNKSHVLVIVFFKNTEIEEQLKNYQVKDEVQRALIEKQINEKAAIVQYLNRMRIQSFLTSPEELTIDVLNKYLEIKAKSLL